MFVNTSSETAFESYIKRDITNITSINTSGTNDDNDLISMASRFSLIVIILSWYIYGKYSFLCLRGLIRHKNFNFLFPLTAALFAFSNNTNDIWNYIYHAKNCEPFFRIFIFTATLNWAPISWLQAYRLAVISNIYLPRRVSLPIITLAVVLSLTYCYCYFNNLINFRKSETVEGCALANGSPWSKRVMLSDLSDSIFSMASICIIIFKSIMHLKELNTKNEKLNNLVGQGIIELFVIALAKTVIYPFIIKFEEKPGFDFFWDILSIIVIISAFNLVNFPYEQSDIEKSRRNDLRRNVFKFFDSNIGSGNNSNYTNYTNNRSTHNATFIKSDSSTYLNNLSKTSLKKEGFNPSFKLNSGGNGTLFNSNTNLFNNDFNGYNSLSRKEVHNSNGTLSKTSNSPTSDITFNTNNYYNKNGNMYTFNYSNY